MRKEGSGPERLGRILERVLKQIGILGDRGGEILVRTWAEVAGPDVASHTRVHSFRGGVLTVAVDSAPLRQELQIYRREELLRGLRERYHQGFVSEIRFRLV